MCYPSPYRHKRSPTESGPQPPSWSSFSPATDTPVSTTAEAPVPTEGRDEEEDDEEVRWGRTDPRVLLSTDVSGTWGVTQWTRCTTLLP